MGKTIIAQFLFYKRNQKDRDRTGVKQRTQDWIEYVKRDLKGAEELLPSEYLANLVLFHCQSCKSGFVSLPTGN
jgi:hypothetical protein